VEIENTTIKMKTVGRRHPGCGLVHTNALLHLVVRLRGHRPFIPKGVHRFRSFEEAQQWSIQMQARSESPDRQPSKTS
jgi:hypothetical protein